MTTEPKTSLFDHCINTVFYGLIAVCVLNIIQSRMAETRYDAKAACLKDIATCTASVNAKVVK